MTCFETQNSLAKLKDLVMKITDIHFLSNFITLGNATYVLLWNVRKGNEGRHYGRVAFLFLFSK